ncbi:penicillin-binding protein 1B [Thaumasiovibrio subtropicus]|uniref:penicillin-binding protein 1B n=1 Tax=Thaumasiovibrio subtropicus TaxID=1891207 RepID=UPI000B3642D9|nr:penicillin-binding protein 1B [Thaumasiovibrio subtropicus]
MAERKSPAKKRTSAKTKTTTRKRRATKKRTVKTKPSRRWGRWLFGFTVKLSLLAIAVLVVVGIYLDGVIRDRFEGQLWHLPSVVYGRVLTLQPGQSISHAAVLKELEVLRYQKVATPRRPGEYSASSTRIEMIRRPFEFVEGFDPERHIMLTFNDSGLQKIERVGQGGQLGFINIEPKMLGMLESRSEEQRLFVPREQLPEVLIDALLVTEDRDFYHHDGVSPLAIVRAMLVNVQAGRTVQGGSTLTQQLAKNMFLSRERTLWRKLREAYIAIILDYRYSKDSILEAYMNEVYLGQSGADAIHGFGLGARLYFDRPLEELRVDQLAMLVAVVKGPSYYNPWRNPERVTQRRDLVLKLLLENGNLTAGEYEQAVSRGLDVQSQARIASRQPAYFQQLRREINTHVGDNFEPGIGLRVFSTLDPLSQQSAEQAVRQMVPNLGKNLETAMVVADRRSGEIRAMIGGVNPGYAGFNRALDARRPIGSLVKPAVYLSALADPSRYHLGTTLDDKPIQLKGSQGSVWQPRNYDRKFSGEVPLYQALARSLNVPTVNLGMAVGLEQVKQTMTELGAPAAEIPTVPAMLLGSVSLTPYETTQMFQTIGSGGQRAPLTALRAVSDIEGNVLYQFWPRASQQVPEQAAWLTTFAMKHAVVSGTGRRLHSQYAWAALAGKTGTTDNNRDSWFVGIDGREVATVWIGKDDNSDTGLTGSSGALRLYQSYLERRVPERLQLSWPAQLSTAKYTKQQSGRLKLDCRGKMELPVWDKDGELKDACNDPLGGFIQRLFN